MAFIGDSDTGSDDGLWSEDFYCWNLWPDLYIARLHLLFN